MSERLTLDIYNIAMDRIKKDCFAYNDRKKECTALTQLECRTKECRFYKKVMP